MIVLESNERGGQTHRRKVVNLNRREVVNLVGISNMVTYY